MDTARLHADAQVVDAHNDLILLVDHMDKRGRTDHFAEFWLPELRAGGVDVQVLPIWIDEDHQSEGALRRTLLLAERIHELAAQYPDDVAICSTAADIDAANRSGRIALVMAIEGAHGIGQDPKLIRTMFRAGVRVASIAHYGRTLLADGSGLDDTARGGLTPQGIEVFTEMERLGMVFDVSHLGVNGVEDVLNLASRPLLATHSTCLVITDNHRSLGDDQIRRIAALGGVVGVAAAIPWFIDPHNPTADRVVDHIEHVVDIAGIDHVGLGPDIIDDYFQEVWGGWPAHAGDPSGNAGAIGPYEPAEIKRPSDLVKVTDAMVRRGFGEQDVKKVLGDNVMRVFRQVMGVPSQRERPSS
ncbi:membrane dipeptidase [Nonomuraea longispora]|uniref:Membrane dipeptidase n=1 Tax=Nonomuraea longispora TaxID=1848320 RepID=A0A4R4NQF9_9ACTN|nr:membrane dipeptidase [Nonomuraea longispora]TDC09372.1 membrane dipeptidase [Nonomuraea longispora]